MKHVVAVFVLVGAVLCSPASLTAVSLYIQSNAQGAEVTIDGRSYGQTDNKGLAYIGDIAPGMHKLILSLEGYKPLTESVRVNERLTTFLKVALELQDKIPPEIMLISPEAPRGIVIVTDKETVEVIGLARDEKGVKAVTVNGKAAGLAEPSREELALFPGKTVRFSLEAPLETGENTIIIQAMDAAGNSSQLEQPVTSQRKPDFLASLDMSCYALLIGIDDYQYWPDLRFPVSEVQELGRDLERSYGFQVETLVNPDKATLLTIVRGYRDKTFSRNDELMIVLSGHGYFDEDSKTGYFMPRDGKLPKDDPIMNTYINYPELNNILNNLPCEHILVVIDACFAGTFNEVLAMRGEEEASAELPREEFILRKLEFKSRMLLSSGGKVKVPERSRFMYRFLEGLRNYGGRDRILTVEELKSTYMDRIDPTPFLMWFGENHPGSSFLFIAR
ncbi:MAG TPA: caspase family protein [archaeon]|nr:caspase family protein [archaeon]